MSKPLVIFWDLETLPSPKEVYKQLPSIGSWPGRTFKGELHTIMSFGYKIQGEDKIRCINGWEFGEGWREDDAPLVHYIYETLLYCDEFVTHNGKKFDLKVLNTKLSKYGFAPLPKIHHVDTRQIAKNHLSFYSNSLDAVAKFYGCENKIHWIDKWQTWCRMAFAEETPADRKQMDTYCKQDVNVLEQVYNHMKPFFGTQAVNRNVITDNKKFVCPTCGDKKVTKFGYRVAGGLRYQRLQCQGCGSWHKLSVNGQKMTPL